MDLSSAPASDAAFSTAIVNIETMVSGDWRRPFVEGDTIICENGRIAFVGKGDTGRVAKADVVIDANGATAMPGLIDSHVHITFGDYTPRQRTVGFLESYVHGGVTTAITASEVHVPGRPADPAGVKALAVAAHKSFLHFRPGGMRVHAGSIILEPGLTETDFREVAAQGVWLAKAGFGAVKTPFDYAPMVAGGKTSWPDHHSPHRRVFHTGVQRHPRRASWWRCSRTSPSISTVARPRCPTLTSASSSRKPKPLCKSAPPATCAPPSCAPISREI